MLLRKTFANLSSQIWKDIRDSEACGIKLGEESITDYLLLKVARSHNLEITVYKFSKRAESQLGADWQWFFLSADNTKAFGIRTQAKRIDVPTLTYKYLDKYFDDPLPGNPQNKRYQVDLLIEDAKIHPTHKIYPLYFFYNYWKNFELSKQLNKRCCGPYRGSPGWTFATADDIRPLAIARKKNLLPDVFNVSYPIQCLFCYNDTSLTLPEGVRSALANIAPNADIPRVYDELPEDIQRIMENPSNFQEFRNSEYLRNVDGVVLIKLKQG